MIEGIRYDGPERRESCIRSIQSEEKIKAIIKWQNKQNGSLQKLEEDFNVIKELVTEVRIEVKSLLVKVGLLVATISFTASALLAVFIKFYV